MKRMMAESRSARIEKKLEFISELYELAFLTDGADETIFQLKRKIEFVNNEEKLVDSCRQIAEQIVILEKNDYSSKTKKACYKIASSLREVFFQVKSLIKDEFRTLRNRNNRLPQIEI